MLSQYLKRLMRREDLSTAEMSEAVGTIMDGAASPAQIAAFLVALRLKGESVPEITGAAQAMRARMTKVPIQREPLVDTCGTGGDGAGTFNISTAVALVVASCGVAVAKHGNRAVSSRSGSADVLAALGVNIEAPPEQMARCVDACGVGFLFAPTLHPAMKHAGAVRRELGVRTIFNVLGPLTNPAGAPHQLMGVFAEELVAPLAAVLGTLGSKRAWVVHGYDGLDEITVCDRTLIGEWHDGEVRTFTLTPEDVGLPRHPPEGLRGGTPEENAAILRELLAGKRPGPIEDAVALNAGAALVTAGVVPDLAAGVRRGQQAIRGGAGLDVLERLIHLSREGSGRDNVQG